ncbi:hypothetical protein WOLCODRAFT_166198 [Wolfiporia cocos MD-104 SS10]|uniref:Uncharacterized protein n=1 Tax=Wolfiporia cocos (strain MD-104) TaxID=742152 RepID=A0A2H3JF20_WOLCO|nr:hypothetical protein WOLCODRAFT_166198 [Wolfiporia cocos MD-104 SS10]
MSANGTLVAGHSGPKFHGHPSRIPGAAPQPPRAAGGSAGALVGGMAAVATGLVAFYMLQFRVQGKRTPSDVKSLTEVPTWQLRHAQQQPGAVKDEPTGSAELYTRQTPDYQPKPSHLPLPGSEGETTGVMSSLLTAAHGKGSDEIQTKRADISQPVATSRLNDTGKMYTKNSDYTDSYKRPEQSGSHGQKDIGTKNL